MSTVQEQSTKRSPLIRITAAVLAVIMILSVVVYQRSGVLLNPVDFEEKSTRVAARELLKGDEYAGADRLTQMAAYVRSLISGGGSLEDLELAVQISIARADYESAAELTKKSIEIYDGDNDGLGNLYLRLGYLYVMLKDSDSAMKWLNAGIALAPTPEAYLARAQVLLNTNQTEAALNDVGTYLDTAENADEQLPDLINVYEAAGDYETAISLYSKLVDREDGTEYLINRAYCYTNLGKMEEAIQDRDRYEKAGGREVAAADVMLGICWMRNGDYTKANESFVRAIDEKYSDPESLYYYVVLCAYVNKDYERACEYGDQLINRVLKGEKTETSSIGMNQSTGRLNVTLVKMDLSSLCLMTGAAHVYRGDFDQAVDSLTACLGVDQGVVYANYLRGSCLLAAEKYDEAIRDFTVAIDAGEEVERSRYGRGVARMYNGDKEGAIEDFEWVVLNGKEKELFNESSLLISEMLNEEETPETETSGT